jgi:Conserved in the green lineage and diatoms 27
VCTAVRPRLRLAPPAASAPGTANGPDEQLPEDGGIAGFDPMEEVGVPKDQRPANELKALRDTFLYSWALLPTPGLLLRVGALFGGIFALLGGPISNATFDPSQQPVEFLLAASAGSLVVVCVALLRVYLGWAYVGNRLLSAVIEYEETGWYDGQLFVKPPKVLARDRLLGTYEVKPALNRLKGILLASGVSVAATSVVLGALINSSRDADGMYGRGAGIAQQQRTYETTRMQDYEDEEEEEELGNMALRDE